MNSMEKRGSEVLAPDMSEAVRLPTAWVALLPDGTPVTLCAYGDRKDAQFQAGWHWWQHVARRAHVRDWFVHAFAAGYRVVECRLVPLEVSDGADVGNGGTIEGARA